MVSKSRSYNKLDDDRDMDGFKVVVELQTSSSSASNCNPNDDRMEQGKKKKTTPSSPSSNHHKYEVDPSSVEVEWGFFENNNNKKKSHHQDIVKALEENLQNEKQQQLHSNKAKTTKHLLSSSSSRSSDETSATERMKEEHLGPHRQYWRDIILGVNDGLVSTFLLVTAVAGGGMSSSRILLTALAGALAGAISMMAGEYMATKSQNEVLFSEIEIEKRHVRLFLEEEITELEGLLEIIGIPPEDTELRRVLLSHYRNHPDALLQVMTTLEFGVVDSEVRSEISAGLFSGFLFVVGSLPSVVPFIFIRDNSTLGLIVAGVVTTVALLLVGAIKTWATRGNWIVSAMENLIIAGCGGAIAYYVGFGFEKIIELYDDGAIATDTLIY